MRARCLSHHRNDGAAAKPGVEPKGSGVQSTDDACARVSEWDCTCAPVYTVTSKLFQRHRVASRLMSYILPV